MLQTQFSRLCVSFSFLVCVTNLVFSSVWQILCIRLCAEVLLGSVWPIYFSFSRDLWSVLSLKIWFTWRVTWRDESVWQVCVTNVMNTSLCRFCPVGVCATNLLSILACLWLVFFLALRMEIWLYSVICDRFLLCDLGLCNVMNASLVITLECLVLGRVVSKWSVSLVPRVILP